MWRGLASRLDPTRDASGVYGTIMTGATIVAVSENAHNVPELAATVVFTLALFWVAHAYSEVVTGGGLSWSAAWHELVAESPMVGACVVPLGVLVLAAALGASFDLATSLGTGAVAVLLVLFGLVAARRAGAGRGAQIVSGAVYGVIGVAIFVLKTLIVH
jgi:hypothetical protein